MKRFTLTAVLLSLCISLPCSLEAGSKKSSVDMKGMNHIFLGWVDMSPDDYHRQGYSTREEYLAVINHANTEFQTICRSKVFSGRTMTAAKNRGDENTAGNDLYVKFSDVVYDHGYRLHLSIHFIDLKTNQEIGSVPLKTYKGHLCGLEACMNKELEEVSRELQKSLAGGGAAEETH
jgi:hypothetical protein